ncbi:prepilin-type N-terminal cleavage/methylation domain-containing protein [Opitutaceae bacterium TAV4]|nr:prepilin-type N-terminal cleavage/methylation domain-containing protein [Opitutaceae bacterium TAV4]RRK02699.1 prepilin-type N-terminal cleavage/methylation domain-containing protein [Opitutaceae bacterium TAV3]
MNNPIQNVSANKRLPLKAFTLIELLTVIAIIGILAAIMIPTVGAVRKKANTAKAITNLRSIYTGFILYANETKDQICPGRDPNLPVGNNARFPWRLRTYVNQPDKVYKTPQSIFQHPMHETLYTLGSFNMNVKCSQSTTTDSVKRFSDFAAPPLQMFLYDYGTDTVEGGGHGSDPANIVKRHDGKAILLFLDGRVQFRAQLDAANSGFWVGKVSPASP